MIRPTPAQIDKRSLAIRQQWMRPEHKLVATDDHAVVRLFLENTQSDLAEVNSEYRKVRCHLSDFREPLAKGRSIIGWMQDPTAIVTFAMICDALGKESSEIKRLLMATLEDDTSRLIRNHNFLCPLCSSHV